jgi:ankyrin repeat protein
MDEMIMAGSQNALNARMWNALGSRDADLVACLLAEGADPKARHRSPDGSPRIALLWVAHKGFDACVDVLARRGGLAARDDQGRDALALASEAGHASTVALLLSLGADPRAVDSWGWSPLMRAAKRGFAECVELLVGTSDLFQANVEGNRASSLAEAGRAPALRDRLLVAEEREALAGHVAAERETSRAGGPRL